MRPIQCRAALIFCIQTMSNCVGQLSSRMCAIQWDGQVPDLCYQNNDTTLLVLLADIIFVDDDLTKLKSTYSSCPYFFGEIKARWKVHSLITSCDSLYTCHERLVILRPAQDLCILLLTEYHDNVGHPNWRRLLASLLKHFVWERMLFDCKNLCSNSVVGKRGEPSRQGSTSLFPLSVSEYPWEIVGMDFVTDLPKSSKLQYDVILILVCHLTINGSLCTMSQRSYRRRDIKSLY